MSQLRVGVVGLRRGLAFVRVFGHHPAATVAAVCDLDAARVEQVQSEYGVPAGFTTYDELLAHPLDAVVIASPMGEHCAQSIAALEQGIHVLCEVPALASLEEAPALVDAVQRSTAKYMLAENCCYWAFIQSWAGMARQGRIGQPIYAEAEYIHDCRSLMVESDGTRTWRASLPPIQYCTHSLGPLLQILDDHCITAVGMHTGSNVAPEIGALDLEVALLRTSRGVPIKILIGFSIERAPAFHYFSVYGTRGVLERPRTGEDRTLAYFADIPEMAGMADLPLGTRHPHAPAHATAGGHGTAEYAMVNAFVASLLNDTPPPINVHRALEMTLPGICAHRSALNGSVPVEVPDFR